MRCAHCQTENKARRRFCAECGVPLAVTCSDCGFNNDPEDKFCGGCGAPLPEAPEREAMRQSPQEPSSGREPAAGSDAERRQLTIMFCDLVGSTALAERLDPEDLSQVISTFQDTCTRAVKDYDGYVAKLIGDGMLAYFGYPQAQEDDPERAVHAALGIVHEIKRLKALPDADLQVRAGVATGLVVVGDLVGEGTAEERAVVGETPNLAARLQTLAAPNTVVAAPTTERLLRGLFEFEDLGEHRIKGMSDPVRAFRAVRPEGVESRFEAYRGRRLTPMVGRTEEIVFIAELWAQAKTGEGRVATLSGEAGIGKSRILETVRGRFIEDGQEAIHLQSSPRHQNTALYPFIDYLSRAAAFGPDASTPVRLEKLEALLTRSCLNLQTVVPLLAELLLIPTADRYPASDPDPQRRRDMTLHAIVDHVVGLAGRGRLLVIFEDVHWLDPTSLDLLGLLIDRAQSEALLLLVTFRPEFDSPWGGLGHVAHLMLNRMTRRQRAEIAGKVADGKRLPDEVLDQIVARTDDVPLFIEEMTKAILDSGLLTEAEDSYLLPGPLPPFAIPATLKDSLMARLDRLGPVKEVAQIGAVIGREFGRELLAAVTGLADDALGDAFEKLADAELVFRRGWPPNAVYVFKHALVQDAAYESLLKEKRRRLHAAVADALEQRFPQITESEPETLAYHLSLSGQIDRASDYWERAGRRAAERSAHVEAAEHLTKSLDGLGSGAEIDSRRELDLNLALAASMRVLGRSDETLRVLDRARALAESPLDKAKVYHLRGNIQFLLGDAEETIAEQQMALTHARAAGSAEFEVHALSGLADGEYMRGRMITAHQYFANCVEMARAHGLHAVEAGNLPAQLNTRYLSTGPNAAYESALADIEETVAAKHPRAELIIRCQASEILSDRLEREVALEQAKRGREACERIGARVWLPMVLATDARAWLFLGEREKATTIAREAAAMTTDASPALTGPWVLGTLAFVAPDRETATAAMEAAEQLIAKGCVAHNQLWFYRDAMDASLRFNDWDRAERYADALETFTMSEPFLWSEFFGARARALARVGRGDRSPDLHSELERLTGEGRRVGFLESGRAIEAALANGWAPLSTAPLDETLNPGHQSNS